MVGLFYFAGPAHRGQHAEGTADDDTMAATQQSRQDGANANFSTIDIVAPSGPKTTLLSQMFLRSMAFSNGSCRCCSPGNSGQDIPDDNEYAAIAQSLQQHSQRIESLFPARAAATQGSTTISQFCYAPMLLPASVQLPAQILETILLDYHGACQLYDTRPNPGVLACWRYQVPCLQPDPPLNDAALLATCEVLQRHVNYSLGFVTRLDLSPRGKPRRNNALPPRYSIGGGRGGFGSHGALALAKVLQTSRYIRVVTLSYNRLGPYGATAIFLACARNPNLQVLHMRGCRMRARGAKACADLVIAPAPSPSDDQHHPWWTTTSPASASNAADKDELATKANGTSDDKAIATHTCGLRELDISANGLGFPGCIAVERAMQKRVQTSGLPLLKIDLEGNLVLQEILNGVTHGMGVILAASGSILLSRKVAGLPMQYIRSCAVYSGSLMALYMSSTLYHSFFVLRSTKYVFEVADKCAIYILISGTYTPFLQVVLAHRQLYSVYLLCFIWLCCLFGILVEAFLPLWQYKGTFSLAMFLGMGWTALGVLPEVVRFVPRDCVNLMVLGGVAYSTGVPFFVRNHNLDHAIWHLFVLAGSTFHWCAIYFYVTSFESDYIM